MSQKQAEWLALRKQHPSAGRDELRRLSPFNADWLLEFAPEWYEANSPAARTPPPPPIEIDWAAEDKRLSEAVKKAAEKIRALPGKPKRVSLSEIIREVGQRAWFETRLDDLPKTKQILDECLESMTSYSVRKGLWTASILSEGSEKITRLEILKHGRIQRKYLENEEVQQAIRAVIA